MDSTWTKALFGDLLHKSEITTEINPTEVYQQITVRMWGNGVASRGWVVGADLGSPRWYIARPQQFILSKIDARHGAFGLVPPDLDGAIVSNDFPLFDIDTSIMLPEYLYWLSRTHDFVDLCKRASEGTTNRIRLRLERFLAAEIPLPPLDEQRRIVAHIDALAAQIAEAHGLRHGALEEAGAILGAELNALLKNAGESKVTWRPIGDFTIYDRYGPRFYNRVYSNIGTRIMRATDVEISGHVNYESMPLMAVNEAEVEQLKLKIGDLAIVRSGSIGLMAVFDRPDIDCIPGAYFIQFRFNETVDPYFVRFCLQSPSLLEELQGRGTAMKNLNANKIKSAQIPLYTLEKQRQIVARLNQMQLKLGRLKHLQSETTAELDALLPSLLDRAFRGEL